MKYTQDYLNSPLITSKENRAEYMEYLAEQNIEGLSSLLNNSLEFEKKEYHNLTNIIVVTLN